MIVDVDPVRMILAMRLLKASDELKFPLIFGNGKAAEFITTEIVKFIEAKKA
jgi:hypothetical protein